MITFYPGPAKVYPQIGKYTQQAVEQGILSQNHRSPAFVELSSQTIRLLKQKLAIPLDYWVFYTSSATECWEIIAQSLIQKQSYHVYNGAFGEKWAHYTKKLGVNTTQYAFDPTTLLDIKQLTIHPTHELIAITHNETSNATALSSSFLHDLRQSFPEQLIAVDATSSLGGVQLDIAQADVWYASVQKCLGLPAGMAIMLCSPKAIERALAINERNHYNSLAFMIEKMQDWQTTYTPNILNIYLLNQVLQQVPSIDKVDKIVKQRAQAYYSFFEKLEGLQLLNENPAVRSATVISLKGSLNRIAHIKNLAKQKNIILGNGYGKWKDTTFRIANFPAIEDFEIELLKDFFNAAMN
ncbi:aminotransferase class V-fold PLP-dependent enzyme [uncultured Microscilla sp.]|uniref:aminotransferase class V-fold PLP-dependent enzyme n=1 Tax=uncultured Microscilla sp. TaxID=432653 RepID=UPI002609D0F3|nr:aminotransferase class V-fold PLP-dependent enzyme [uncultured Microscilla sp.]